MQQLLKIYSFSIIPLLAALAVVSSSGYKDPESGSGSRCITSTPMIWSGNRAVDIPLLFNYGNVVIEDAHYAKVAGEKTMRFYNTNGHRTKWLGTDGPLPLYFTLIETLQSSGIHGLNPCDYGPEELTEATQKLYATKAEVLSIIQQDVELTRTYFLYTTHLSEGRIRNVGHENAPWKREYRPKNDIVALHEAQDADGLHEKLHTFHPRSVQYTQLQVALTQYNKLDGEYPEGFLRFFSVDKTIEPGERHESIPAVRRRLALTDMNINVPKDSTLYDTHLEQGVKAFQARHGLEQDGRIGKRTVAFLNMSFREKADLIALNLERARWQSGEMQGVYIVINIPEYMLRVYDGDREVMCMKVIVGKEYLSTPVFNDSIGHLVFSPTWGVPQSIIQNEMIPRLKTDPGAYSNKNFEVYENGIAVDPSSVDWNAVESRYDFVQRPGNSNALGLVKFVLHNDMRVYLHDTPTDHLFDRTERALSHGCIRLAEPAKLAEYLLRDQSDWCEESITSAMHCGIPKQVRLKRPVPVHVIYQTAWVDAEGKINFREDIYGHDRHQMASLKGFEDML